MGVCPLTVINHLSSICEDNLFCIGTLSVIDKTYKVIVVSVEGFVKAKMSSSFGTKGHRGDGGLATRS